jgi:hypothetical protein
MIRKQAWQSEKAWQKVRRIRLGVGASSALTMLVGAALCNACTAVTMVDLFAEKAAGGIAGQSPNAQAGASVSVGGRNAGGSNAGVAGAANTQVCSSASGGGNAAAAGAPSVSRLVNRYDFSGTGTVVVDSVSCKNGEIMGGAVLDGTGKLTLTGDPLEYVKLPSWMISSMTSATIVTWFTWHGGPAWQSVFNFGGNEENSDVPSERVNAEVFFTPLMSVLTNSSLHVAIVFGRAVDAIDPPDPFPTDQPMMVAAVFHGDLRQIRLYYNGVQMLQPVTMTLPLANLKDGNCWLGQSQWEHDVTKGGNFRGVYDEFRIYSGALTAEQIQKLSLTDPNLL